jgi:peptide/nickel transport system permease protein
MLRYTVHRLIVMVPTLLAISVLVFVIIQLPPGDYLTTYIDELLSQGETVNAERIEFLRQQYGFDKHPVEQYFIWVFGLLQGNLGYSFEHSLPVTEVIGDRILLTFIVSFSTIIFTWAVSFVIGTYSAVYQYSLGDYALSFLGFVGLATPNFLLALVLLWLANAYFGTSIGGLMDPDYLDQPQGGVGAGASVASGRGAPHVGHRRHDPAAARQPVGRAAQTICGDRAGQGAASLQGSHQIPLAHVAEPLHRRYR